MRHATAVDFRLCSIRTHTASYTVKSSIEMERHQYYFIESPAKTEYIGDGRENEHQFLLFIPLRSHATDYTVWAQQRYENTKKNTIVLYSCGGHENRFISIYNIYTISTQAVKCHDYIGINFYGHQDFVDFDCTFTHWMPFNIMVCIGIVWWIISVKKSLQLFPRRRKKITTPAHTHTHNGQGYTLNDCLFGPICHCMRIRIHDWVRGLWCECFYYGTQNKPNETKLTNRIQREMLPKFSICLPLIKIETEMMTPLAVDMTFLHVYAATAW